jgi:hypothetical protein
MLAQASIHSAVKCNGRIPWATVDAGLRQHDLDYWCKSTRKPTGAGSATLPAGGSLYFNASSYQAATSSRILASSDSAR